MCQKVNFQANRRSSLELTIPVYGAGPSVNGDIRSKLFRKRNNRKFKTQTSLEEYVPNLSASTSQLQNDSGVQDRQPIDVNDEKSMEPYTGDALAVVTQISREFYIALKTMAQNGKKSTAYSVLTSTTQPAHIITVLVTLFIVYVIWPKVMGTANPVRKANIFSMILYLGSFATHFGAQIWMTFVSGLALYFSLPRHIFGLCQQVLFPKYYALGAVLSIITLFCYVRTSQSDLHEASYLQVTVLTLCAVVELIIRLYLAPPLLTLMRVKHEFEIKAGTGREIGQHNQGGLIHCPHYQKIHKTFRRIHMTIAIGNIISLACTFIHLEYLASKINL